METQLVSDYNDIDYVELEREVVASLKLSNKSSYNVLNVTDFNLYLGDNYVGRSDKGNRKESYEVELDDPSVSSLHAEICITRDEKYSFFTTIKSFPKANLTFVMENEESGNKYLPLPSGQKKELKNYDSIRFGQVECIFQYVDVDAQNGIDDRFNDMETQEFGALGGLNAATQALSSINEVNTASSTQESNHFDTIHPPDDSKDDDLVSNSDATEVDEEMIIVEDDTQFYSCHELPAPVERHPITTKPAYIEAISEVDSEMSEDLAAEVEYDEGMIDYDNNYEAVDDECNVSDAAEAPTILDISHASFDHAVMLPHDEAENRDHIVQVPVTVNSEPTIHPQPLVSDVMLTDQVSQDKTIGSIAELSTACENIMNELNSMNSLDSDIVMSPTDQHVVDDQHHVVDNQQHVTEAIASPLRSTVSSPSRQRSQLSNVRFADQDTSMIPGIMSESLPADSIDLDPMVEDNDIKHNQPTIETVAIGPTSTTSSAKKATSSRKRKNKSEILQSIISSEHPDTPSSNDGIDNMVEAMTNHDTNNVDSASHETSKSSEPISASSTQIINALCNTPLHEHVVEPMQSHRQSSYSRKPANSKQQPESNNIRPTTAEVTSSPHDNIEEADNIRLFHTGLSDDDKALIPDLCKQIGVMLVDDVTQATHMIIHDAIKRTPKFMIALNSGVRYFVCMNWLLDSAAKNAAINLDNNNMMKKYVPHDASKEKLWGFKLINTLSMNRVGKLFDGITFYICDKVCGGTKAIAPPQDDMTSIIESGGGVVIFATSKSTPAKGKRKTSDDTSSPINNAMLIASDASISEYEETLAVQGPGQGKVYLPEVIFSAVVRQHLDLNVGILTTINDHVSSSTREKKSSRSAKKLRSG